MALDFEVIFRLDVFATWMQLRFVPELSWFTTQ